MVTHAPITEGAATNIEKLIIQFDSSAALLKSLAFFHQNQDVSGLCPDLPPWVKDIVNKTPKALRQSLYSWSGWIDALHAKEVNRINPDEIASWVCAMYPDKKYSGVTFGSSNGAAIHLAAAMGAAWLPQTYLVAVRRMMKPDKILGDIEWGRRTIEPLLSAHSCLHVAQMHDPVQDRLMVAKMGYFRLKMLSLPSAFENFIIRNSGAEKPIISIECTYSWPVKHISDHHTFQLGGFGAIEPYEYLQGSPRTRLFLQRQKAASSHWETFEPDYEMPEAEWGYDDRANASLLEIARRNNAPFYRLIFNHPEGLSTFSCDIYRWWFKKRMGLDSRKMLIENFALVAPYRAVVSGSLPFWLAFNTQNSADLLENYLRDHAPLDDMYLLLMSNGVTEGIGLTTMAKWKMILQSARRKGCFIGVDEREYPLDFASFLRYQDELVEVLPQTNPLPEPLTLEEIEAFAKRPKYKVKIERAG